MSEKYKESCMKFTNEELRKYLIDKVKKCECSNLDIRLLSDDGVEIDNNSDIKIETIVFDGEEANLFINFYGVQTSIFSFDEEIMFIDEKSKGIYTSSDVDKNVVYEGSLREMTHEEMQIILKEYIRDVECVCNILIKSLNDSQNLNLKNKYDFFEYRSSCKKTELEAEGIRYIFHGKGCTAFSKGRKIIDWDFGYRSRWCGIDPWKVSMTLKENNSPHVQYYDGKLIQTACEHLVKIGVMFKKYDQYYFEMTADETFKPEFPMEYDVLIIEYFNSNWSIPRNKVIDRFIRKSTRVHNQIYKEEDKYILKFLLDGREIYTIPYNDISYPENAVKIMSDEIIRNLLKVQ